MNFDKLREIEEQILVLDDEEKVWIAGFCKGLMGDFK